MGYWEQLDTERWLAESTAPRRYRPTWSTLFRSVHPEQVIYLLRHEAPFTISALTERLRSTTSRVRALLDRMEAQGQIQSWRVYRLEPHGATVVYALPRKDQS